MFKTLPKHSSVLDLFPQRTQHGFQQQPQEPSPGSAMDESFGSGSQDVSIDDIHEGTGDNDVSFASTFSLRSSISPPSFRQMESSPYGMDICSPSPGHPMYGKRIVPQYRVEDSGAKVFGRQLDFDLPVPTYNNPPGSLLKRLTADVGNDSFSPMSVGSFRSNRSSTGKVGSIKTISTIKDRDPLSKARARSRTALPSTWMEQRPQSMIQLPESRTLEVLSQGYTDDSVRSENDSGDVSMEDAMDVDSPLAARRPPKAQLKPRPLTLFIPSTVHSPTPSQQDSAGSTVPATAISGGPDEFGQYFFDTPEPAARTAILRYNNNGTEESPYPFGGGGGFPGSQRRDSSPLASPSAERVMRCLSAVAPPSSASSSSSRFTLQSGSSNTASSTSSQPKTAGPNATSRIPSLRNKALLRPDLSTLSTGLQAQETQSAGVVPSARMASLNQRRAMSAFIQPEQLHSAPFSIQGQAGKTAIPRPAQGLAKGRVVSMLVPSTGSDDFDDSGNEFSSPSLARGAAAGHRRMRSNGGLGIVGRGGSLAMRTTSQQQIKANNVFGTLSGTDPSPVSSLLPFGDGEHDGKILPCHSVKEDGLMRITPATLKALISGAYNAHISSYQIIDCRFAFEYEGGHVDGAINLNKDEDIERFLFDDVIRRGELPAPCQSGQPGLRPPILVFHCEFSAKRGPTFAKHFRGKDRSRNAQYPKLHYPELYILEGGYCSYFSAYPETCEPRGYVKMDAPQHSHARATDLGQFRKWNRTRSYTYGDAQAPTQIVPSIQPSQSLENAEYKRSVAGRLASQYTTHERVQSFQGLQTLQEDHGSPEEHDVEDTPDLDHGPEYDEETPDVLTEAGSNDDAAYYDAPETQDASFDIEEESLELADFGASEAAIDLGEPYEEEVEEEDEEDDDGLDHVDSSPCVTAEMKRNKNSGRSLLERTFKPLGFGKPHSLSLIPQSRARGMSRAISHIV